MKNRKFEKQNKTTLFLIYKNFLIKIEELIYYGSYKIPYNKLISLYIQLKNKIFMSEI